MLQANQQLLNPIPRVEWAYWIKVIKGELMHLSEQRESRGYMRKLDVTGIAHSFNLAHLSSTFRANSVNDVTATKKKKKKSFHAVFPVLLLMHIRRERSG